MNEVQQSRDGGSAALRDRLSAASRRAVGYFVEPSHPDELDAVARDQDTAEFVPDVPAALAPPVVLPLARLGGYEREPVDRRLAELESQLALARAQAATPRGVEAEIQYLGEETAEILRVAHQKAGILVARATEEAAALRAAAQADAERITEDAQRRLRRLDTETELVWAERARLTEDILRLADALKVIAESAVERFPPAVDDPPPEPRVDEPRSVAIPKPPVAEPAALVGEDGIRPV